MDEPTAALSRHEIEDLSALFARLKAEGKAILFISHKFDEIFAVANVYVVFRDSRYIGGWLLSKASIQAELVSMMVRRTEDHGMYPKRTGQSLETRCSKWKDSHIRPSSRHSFALRRGEILGFYGLVGAGRSEVMQAIFGITPPNSRSRTRQSGREVTYHQSSGTRSARRNRLRTGGSRQAKASCCPLPIVQNMSLPQLGKTAHEVS